MATNPDAPVGLDLTACDREAIHLPGAIQPHGLLLLADAATLRVVAGAGDIESRLAPDWLGRGLSDLLGQDIAALLDPGPVGPGGTAIGAVVAGHDVAVHRVDRYVVAELEPPDARVRHAGQTLAWLDAVGGGFERASTLTTLCERAAVAFRELTGFARVMIYRFRDDDAGVVVAEDRDPALGSFLHHHFPASDIPRQARALYVRNRTRVIRDIDYTPAPLRPAGFAATDLSDVAIRSVSPIHLQYLRNMGVAASASISIVSDGILWGLVACHNDTPRHIPREVRSIAAALAGDLARQIRGKEAAATYRERLALRAGEDALHPLLFDHGEPTEAVVRRGDELRRMFDADGVALVQGGEVVGDGLMPPVETMLEFVRWLGRRDDATIFSSRELGRDWPAAASFGALAGVLAIRHGDATLLWLRAEEVEEVEWAGNPHKAVSPDPHEPLRPRASFESWRQLVRGRTRRWTLEQAEAARRLHRLLREARDAAELRRLNAELTQTVAEKDAALAQKDLLMREVDHRVQNSLQLVASFLSIQARDAGPGAVADQLVEARSRLSAVALVHRRLYRDDQIATIDLSRYLGELLEDMKASLGDGWARAMTIDLAPVLIPTDRAVNIGLIAAELVINATKYAYPGAEAGPIAVVLDEHLHRLRLVVADHGVGKATTREGFGSRMMRAVVQRIDGTVDYRDNGPGLRAVLTAPIERE